jgi:predicted methyltransferase
MKPRYRAIIDRAIRFKMQKVLQRYANDYQATLENAEHLERELKRYLILRALHPRKRYPMAGPVDGLWHTFLLFTRLYARFCNRVAGRFLHHTPADIENRQELRQFQKDYANLWKDYPRVFAEPPPSSIWPTLQMICNGDGNKPLEDPDVKECLGKFEAEKREVFAKRKEVVAACRLQPGMAVADVGACTGLFTRLFAAAVGPSGKVYAVDIVRPFIEYIEKTCREQGLGNVAGVVCSATSVELPPTSVDLVFLCATYSRFEFPFQTMQSIHRALRPGGQVVLIDLQRIPGVSLEWALKHVRAGQEDFSREILESGFKLVEESKLLEESYCLRFVKVEGSGRNNSPGLRQVGKLRAQATADGGGAGIPPVGGRSRGVARLRPPERQPSRPSPRCPPPARPKTTEGF